MLEFKEEYFPLTVKDVSGLTVRNTDEEPHGTYCVDSGQFMIASMSAREAVIKNHEYRDKRVYHHVDGRQIPTSIAETNWQQIAMDGKSFYELKQAGLIVQSREPREEVLGYQLACDISLSETHCDVVLNTCFSSTYNGDGRYPVFVSDDAKCVFIDIGLEEDQVVKDTDLIQQIGEIEVLPDDTIWAVIDPCYRNENTDLGVHIDLVEGKYTVYRMCVDSSDDQDIGDFNAIVLIHQ